MSAFSIARNNISTRTIVFVLSIIGLISLSDIIMFAEGYKGFLYSSFGPLVATFIFAIIMTLWSIKKMVSVSSFDINEHNNKLTLVFIIFHLLIASVIGGCVLTQYLSSFYDVLGYMILPIVIVVISVISNRLNA